MDGHEHLDLRALPGSERAPAPGVKKAGSPLPGDAPVEATLILRRRAELNDATLGAILSRDELAVAHGADPADVDLVVGLLTGLGVEVLSIDAASRRVRVAGTVALLSGVFGTSLEAVTSKDAAGDEVSHRHRTGGLSVTAELDGVVTNVLGLDDRPQARAHFRTAAAASSATSYTPLQLGTIYRFPGGTDGSGQTIGIVELGGGFAQSDLDTYFAGLAITGPSVRAVGVDGAVNKAGADPNGADGEVLLDIEVAWALAPKASLVVYFAPNTDAGFLNALTAAVNDNLRKPCVVSISWGAAESDWTAQATSGFDSACSDAALLGITVCVAAGDHGATDSDVASVTRANADFPASSPHVLACGGTRLETANGAITSETVWNNHDGWATGGGVSEVFQVPAFQSGASIPNSINQGGKKGRGVPDVAGDADGDTGYKVRVDSVNAVFGGTSAVAPLWAGLIAVLTQGKGGSIGFLTPRLYKLPAASQALRDIVAGDNNCYHAGAGWDACTGLGVPNGAKLLSAL